MYLPKLQCNFPFSGAAPDSNERVCPHFVPTSLPLSTQLFSLPGEHGGEMMTMWMEMVAMMGWLGWYIWWCWCCWCWCWWWCWWWWCWYWWWGLCRWWTKAKTCSLLIPDKSSRLILKVTILQMRIGCLNSGNFQSIFDDLSLLQDRSQGLRPTMIPCEGWLRNESKRSRKVS